ncbi:hypothetical protein [Streptomyces massasporeus]|uniref:hypothetical protein n=1 Tax=Streptomyces massasporeus TaxID=67324 RepID=UPI001676F9BD|nr:hypothetical protein [Streptomyces massasporeus]GGV76807.1 hypothetical protein GCM10010228_42450 [Streptomyces massasporeus]
MAGARGRWRTLTPAASKGRARARHKQSRNPRAHWLLLALPLLFALLIFQGWTQHEVDRWGWSVEVLRNSSSGRLITASNSSTRVS